MAAGRRAANAQGDQSTGSPSIPDARRMPARARPVTMKDVAAATGVSRSTVSRILNDAPLTVPVSAATRTRVLAAARELEYRPNPLARALRGAPTMLLGAIVRDITDPFFAGAIETVSVAARARGYNVVLGHAHGEATKAHELAALLEAGHCDAILMMGDMSDQPRLLEDLRDTHIPVVALWQGSELRSIPAVNVDNQAGVTATMAHARIVAIDVSAARSMPGVLDIVTAADLDIGPAGLTDKSWPASMARPLLATDTVRTPTSH